MCSCVLNRMWCISHVIDRLNADMMGCLHNMVTLTDHTEIRILGMAYIRNPYSIWYLRSPYTRKPCKWHPTELPVYYPWNTTPPLWQGMPDPWEIKRLRGIWNFALVILRNCKKPENLEWFSNLWQPFLLPGKLDGCFPNALIGNARASWLWGAVRYTCPATKVEWV